MNFLWYADCSMYIRISQLTDHYISVDQDIYATSVVAKYLGTAKIKDDSKFHNTTLTNDMVFTKDYASTSDKQV